jgi:glycosyltransferase involved in cell wall biosynthesis
MSRNHSSTSPPPHRIVFCITELEPGGAERCLVELVKRLNRHRFDPVVYCLGPRPTGNPLSLTGELDAQLVKVHYFGARRAVGLPRVLLKLRRQLRVDRPQIVQAFLFHANTAASMAARLAGVQHLLTGIRVAEPHRRWRLAVARRTDRWVERHVCVSQAVRDFAIAEAGLPEHKLVVIPNGVDLPRFADAKPAPLEEVGIPAGRRAMVYVGRLDRQKGLPWLLKLLPPVFAGLPAHDLLLVGQGPQRKSLQRLASELGIGARVHFTGFRADVPEILAASDLLLLPSQWEGMPNVVLEAMAGGKPIVATNAEGVAEALGPLALDQVAAKNAPEAFATRILAILNDPQLCARLGQQNQQRARLHFSWESMVDSYQQLYLSLLA